MEHPAAGEHREARVPSAFARCRPDRRCGVCRLLGAQPPRERAIFRVLLGQDPELAGELERLASLFHDAAPAG